MELIRFLFANIGHSGAYYHLVNVKREMEGIIRPVDREFAREYAWPLIDLSHL